MYSFANQNDVRELAKWCESIIRTIQKDLKEYITFSFNLIGSGGKKLVTQNADEAFDLDYNLIIQKDRQGLIDNPKKLKNIILNAFDRRLKENVEGYKGAKDSKSVITIIFSNGIKELFRLMWQFMWRLTTDIHTNLSMIKKIENIFGIKYRNQKIIRKKCKLSRKLENGKNLRNDILN